MPAAFENGILGGTVAGQRWKAWHGLGIMVPEHVFTAEEAMRQVPELATEVVARPLYWQDSAGEFHLIDTEVANVRDLDSKWLANVTKTYERVQPWEAFQFMDDLVDSGQAKYHTAMTLDGGRRVCLTVSLTELGMKVAGMENETHEVFLVLTNSYDRSSGLQVCASIIRVVCANTEAMAFANAPRIWSMRHTESIKGKLANARDTLGLVQSYIDEWSAAAEKLAAQPLTSKQYGKFLEDLILPTPEIVASDRRSQNRKETLSAIDMIYQTAPNLEAVRGTKWAAYNAVTEYSDWFTSVKDGKRSTAEERRFVNQNAQSPLKDRALELLLV